MCYQLVVPTSLDVFDQEWRDNLRAEMALSGPRFDRIDGDTEVLFLDDGEIRQEVVAKTEDNPVMSLICTELIDRCLCRLGRTVILHRYYGNMTVEETAEIMKIPEKRVRRIESLALKSMREGKRLI